MHVFVPVSRHNDGTLQDDASDLAADLDAEYDLRDGQVDMSELESELDALMSEIETMTAGQMNAEFESWKKGDRVEARYLPSAMPDFSKLKHRHHSGTACVSYSCGCACPCALVQVRWLAAASLGAAAAIWGPPGVRGSALRRDLTWSSRGIMRGSTSGLKSSSHDAS